MKHSYDKSVSAKWTQREKNQQDRGKTVSIQQTRSHEKVRSAKGTQLNLLSPGIPSTQIISIQQEKKIQRHIHFAINK